LEKSLPPAVAQCDSGSGGRVGCEKSAAGSDANLFLLAQALAAVEELISMKKYTSKFSFSFLQQQFLRALRFRQINLACTSSAAYRSEVSSFSTRDLSRSVC